MNQIHAALQKSGVPLPTVGKRIWLWLKDHPEKTSGEIATALKLEKNNISSIISQLEKRGVFKKKKEIRKNLGARLVDVYSVVNPNEYAVNSLTAGRVKKAKLLAEAVAVSGLKPQSEPQSLKPDVEAVSGLKPQKEIAGAISGPKPQSLKPDVEAMTVGQARELYSILHKLFGN